MHNTRCPAKEIIPGATLDQKGTIQKVKHERDNAGPKISHNVLSRLFACTQRSPFWKTLSDVRTLPCRKASLLWAGSESVHHKFCAERLIPVDRQKAQHSDKEIVIEHKGHPIGNQQDPKKSPRHESANKTCGSPRQPVLQRQIFDRPWEKACNVSSEGDVPDVQRPEPNAPETQ
eukprot:CAMPEP_0174281316 /NCGR_PEP_ID=MMETSP0809-20121228/1701_1 /TAXON_ID=73025 ORGANISM="Eutreptiella gymnastica-like, Strain CCMP1594" /NCGR_SAMPLE_ID=MMETSP0809 /ASSEMBLY_ACC=CAM_ASM_000658 /LENGTH=174 /DNA_ID=CAMNT_0015374799 /DNA_START=212 /DNA_END=736 /DNA_ORIENTATION=+